MTYNAILVHQEGQHCDITFLEILLYKCFFFLPGS